MSAPPLVELHAVTHVERLEGVARARFAMGGWITAHQQFSNVSLCLWFEIDGRRLLKPGKALAQEGILLTRDAGGPGRRDDLLASDLFPA